MAIVKITAIGFETLTNLSRYMAEFIGEDKAIDLADTLIDTVEKTLSKYPKRCPTCHELELIGVTDYLQLTIDKYKILYRYDDVENIVYVNAFMRHRQSAQELLISCALSR